VSLNEVGGEPDRFGVPPEVLHRWLSTRAERWPHAMSASSTHDTKRSEDVRARLNVLSEIPGAWTQAIGRWARLNRRGRSVVDGQAYPSRNEEYLLYQTLVGTWPLAPMNAAEERQYESRILAYMHKAMREATVFTSWQNPSARHEDAMARFVGFVLSPENVAFREEFLRFEQRVARHGIYNSLAVLTLKIGAPGIPDFYRGTETWEFSLVDPDNRRPLDFAENRALLHALDCAVAGAGTAAVAAQLLGDPADPRLKLFTTSTLLRFRRQHAAVFRDGGYEPLQTGGARSEHVFAFARALGDDAVIVAVPRMIVALQPAADIPPLGERVWGDTRIELPAGTASRYRHVLTGECLHARLPGNGPALAAADLFARFPVAVLHAQ
jgi:(1->4)-alpha-D-glucan 1-alpha-D-glucosylmutase